jgi:hypothetical protein
MSDKVIPVSAAQALAESLDLRQVIIAAWDGERTHVVTYGGSVEDSANAAAGGNVIKARLGWPESLRAESPKVLALQERIAELEKQLSTLSSQPRMVHVVHGTEHERGWGWRPDGYVAFLDKASADQWIDGYHKTNNNQKRVPDNYTTYAYFGAVECSDGFYKAVQQKGFKLFNRMSEVLE